MTFTANAIGGTQDSVTYNWTVSAGSIVSGQGTPVITVQTTPDMAGSNVTATVEFGNLCVACTDRTRSETAGVARPDEARRFTEFTTAVPDEIKAQLDPFYSELSNNPNATGYIINYGTPAQIAKREREIKSAIAFRKYDLGRVTFVKGGDNGNGVRTVFYIVPANVTPPTPEY